MQDSERGRETIIVSKSKQCTAVWGIGYVLCAFHSNNQIQFCQLDDRITIAKEKKQTRNILALEATKQAADETEMHLHKEGIMSSEWSHLQDANSHAEAEGYRLLWFLRLSWVQRLAEEALQEEQQKNYAKIVLAKAAVPTWEPREDPGMYFGNVWSNSDSTNSEMTSDDKILFWNHWVNAAMNDVWLAAFMKAGQGDSEQFVNIVEDLDREQQTAGRDQPEWLATKINNVMLQMKAWAQTACPEPYLFGLSQEDVNKAFPTARTVKEFLEEFPGVGKSLHRDFTTKDGNWFKLRKDANDFHPRDLANTQEFQCIKSGIQQCLEWKRMDLQAVETGNPGPSTDIGDSQAKLFKDFPSRFQDFLTNCRPDGTVRIQKGMLELIQLIWLDFGNKDKPDLGEIEKGQSLASIIQSLKIPGAKELHLNMQNAIGTWQDALSSSALEATSAQLQKDHTLASCHRFLKALIGNSQRPFECKEILTSLHISFQVATKIGLGDQWDAEAIKPFFEGWQCATTIPAIKDMQPSMPDALEAMHTALKHWGTAQEQLASYEVLSKESPDDERLPNHIMAALSNLTSLIAMEFRHLEGDPISPLQMKADKLSKTIRERGLQALRHTAGIIIPRLAASVAELKQVARGGKTLHHGPKSTRINQFPSNF